MPVSSERECRRRKGFLRHRGGEREDHQGRLVYLHVKESAKREPRYDTGSEKRTQVNAVDTMNAKVEHIIAHRVHQSDSQAAK